MTVFGTSVLSARSFSVLCGFATIVAAWWFVKTAIALPEGSKLNRRPVEAMLLPLVAALLVTVGALQVEMSLEARPYILGTFLALLSGMFLLCATRKPQIPGDWIGFAVTAAALSLTHYYGLFTLAAFFLFLASETVLSGWQTGWSSRTKSLLVGTGASAWGIQLCWLPWLETFSFQRERADRQLWMGPLSWDEIASTCWKILGGGKVSEVWPDWAWLAVAAWGALSMSMLIFGGRSGRLAGLCALTPLMASVGYSLAVRNILGVRYLIFAEVYLLVGCALLAQGRWPALRWSILAAVVMWCGFWCWRFSERREFVAAFPGTQGAVSYLNEKRSADEPVIVSSAFVHTIALAYLQSTANVLTQYAGDHRANILSGPALQESDYAGIPELLSGRPPRLWTIDADGLFGGMSIVRVPEAYQLVSAERFPERFGYRMDLLVREYRLVAPTTADKVANGN